MICRISAESSRYFCQPLSLTTYRNKKNSFSHPYKIIFLKISAHLDKNLAGSVVLVNAALCIMLNY